MFAFLLSVGILVSIVSMFTIGFGIPNNGFDVGNTMIIAGTTGLGAGLVVIGLAACLRELRRLSHALAARPAARPVRGLEPADAQTAASPRGPQSPRMPYPPLPADGEREPAPVEPRLSVPPLDAAEEPAAERPRPNIFAVARTTGEGAAHEEAEPVPFPVARAAAAPAGRVSPPPADAPYEPRFGPSDILARIGGSGRSAGKGDAPRPGGDRSGDRSMGRPAEPPPPERARGAAFETTWTPGGKGARPAGPDTIARAARPEPRTEPRAEPRPEPRSEPRPELRIEPKIEMREPAEPPVGGEPREAAPPPPSEARAVSILKSGVIDGMAYTLYTDGSIEAELPQGTMRFASIEELRTHLERHE